MDKSEGTDFFSKTFGSISEKVAKLYHKGQATVSTASLKRSKNEKLALLGAKVYQLMDAGNTITKENVSSEFDSIKDLESKITEAEKDVEKLKKHKVNKGDGGFDLKDEKKAKATTTEAAKKPVKKAAVKKTPAKKTAAKKPATKKTVTPKAGSTPNSAETATKNEE